MLTGNCLRVTVELLFCYSYSQTQDQKTKEQQVNLHVLPQIMDAAGIDLTTSSLWNVWETNINQEIARRQSLKRSISTSSLPRTLSDPSLSLDVSAASSSRSARSVGDVSSGICVSESMDVDRESMVSFSHPRENQTASARDHVNVRAGEDFAIVWPPSPVRASQILQVQPSDTDTPSTLARMTEDMRFTSISSMTKG